MTQICEIDDQSLSSLLCVDLICQACGVVDRDYDRTMSGHKCRTCGATGGSGRLAFDTNIHILVNLVQQAYHSSSAAEQDGERASNVGTIIYFCTLREALLNTFLIANLRAKKTPTAIIERLLGDNRLTNQRFGALFTSVVGCTWDTAVKTCSESSNTDFGPVSELMKSVARLRNEFLHEGRSWGITREIATDCVNALGYLLPLYVNLHNEYTHPVTRRGDA